MRIDINIINQLSERWFNSGIKPGDTILLHSNIRRLLLEFKDKKINLDANLVLQSFLKTIGNEGTLILPLFNFDFCKGILFDINSTKSRMGALTELSRAKKDCVRTGHPVYSFGVFGKKKNIFKNLDNQSAYSDESPFGFLRRLNGKIAVLDLDDQNSMTYYHHIEEICNVSYRYFKNFTGPYIGFDKKKNMRTYKIFVRKLDLGIVTNVNPASDLLWKENLYYGDKPFYKSGLRVINSVLMFDYISYIIKSGKALNIIYSVNKLSGN